MLAKRPSATTPALLALVLVLAAAGPGRAQGRAATAAPGGGPGATQTPDAGPAAAATRLGRGGPGEVAPAAAGLPAREGFVVQAFANPGGIRSLDFLRHALPGLVAERLASERPLRFEGGPEIFARAPVPAARWVVTGSFLRQRDWRVEVTVEVRPAAAPEEVAARASRVGTKEEVATTGLLAALAAFRETPGLELATDPAAELVRVPFARDPYAFVLYGRGLAAAAGEQAPPARTARAVALLQRCLLIDPRVPEARRLLGVAQLAAGRLPEARAAFAQALELRPDYVAALRSLAALDRAAGLPTARERHAQLVILDPHDLAARRALGELLAEAGELAAAERELQTVLATAPGDLEARRSLVLVLAARQAGKELVAALEEVARLDPESIDVRMDLGAAHLAVGQIDPAAAAYEEVLRRRPRHAGALKLAADLARSRGDLKLAATYYTRLRQVAPGDPRPVFLLATAHAEAGQLDQAERLFTEGSFFPGMRGEALGNLGALALRRGQARQALWFLGRAVRLRPEKAGIRYNHALALHQVGSDATALGELRAAEALDPEDAGVRFLAGVVALRLGLLDEAAASFRATLAIDPRHADAAHNLAILDGMGVGSERSLTVE